MNIGYSVEGSTDRALLTGLQRRWCPGAKMIPGRFRGTSGLSARREIPKICIELGEKDADVIIFLRDANTEPWRDVLKDDEARCEVAHRSFAIFGVCGRNVESWLAADPDFIAQRFQRSRSDFAVSDPKGAVESAFGISRHDKKEEELASFVASAPLNRWLHNKSFEHFYEQIWQKSKELQCPNMENLRERIR